MPLDRDRYMLWLERCRQLHAEATKNLCRHGPNCVECKPKPTTEGEAK